MAGNKYGDRLKMYRSHAGLTQKELADKIGVDHSVVSNWERGINKYDIEMLMPISEALDVSVNDLLGFYTDYSLNPEEEKLLKMFRELEEPGNKLVINTAEALLKYKDNLINAAEKVKKFISHPVFLMPASAGTGSFLDSDEYELIDFPEKAIPRESNFAVRVSGDSMQPDYPDGSVVFVKQTKHLDPGEVGIFILNNEGFLKVLGENQCLESINPDYSPIKIEAWDDCRLVGKVVGSYNLESK